MVEWEQGEIMLVMMIHLRTDLLIYQTGGSHTTCLSLVSDDHVMNSEIPLIRSQPELTKVAPIVNQAKKFQNSNKMTSLVPKIYSF